jgi:hypothetical protein
VKKLLFAVLLSSLSLSAFAVPGEDLFNQWDSSGKDTIVAPPSSSANAVYGGTFDIVDLGKSIDFEFVGAFGTKYQVTLFVASVDSAGNLIGGYDRVYDAFNGKLYTFLDSDSYTAKAGATGVKFEIYVWVDDGGASPTYLYWDGDGSMNADKSQNLDKREHVVSFDNYSDGKTLIGFESEYRRPVEGGYTPWPNDSDFNDMIILASNVQTVGGTRTTPPIPEPEAYAMMLAGLCMIGSVVRRRMLPRH